MSEKPFNIVNYFFQAADKFPDHPAINHGSQTVSFSVLQKMVSETAAYFQNKGIAKGDRVLVFVPVSIGLYRIVLALFKIGATAVFLDEWVSFKRLEACCAVADCRAFIGIPKARLLGLLSAGVRAIPIKLGLDYKKGKSNLADIITTNEDIALITFTTGSTGKPKAANRSHGFLNEQFNALKEKINTSASDVDMPAFPVVLLLNLGVGALSVIPSFNSRKPDTLDPKKIIKQLNDQRVSRIEASPFFIRKLADHILREKINLPHLKFIFTGGAPVFPAEATIFMKAFPGTDIVIVYGATEAEPISTITAAELCGTGSGKITRGLMVGKPYRQSHVKIVQLTDNDIVCGNDDELKKIELADGEIGEIIVSGPHVLSSYFNNQEAFNRNKIKVGVTTWHRTGDSGYFENGVLYLTGRCNTLIRQGGKWIATFMVENYLQTIPSVRLGTLMEIAGKLWMAVELKKGEQKKELRNELMTLGLEVDQLVFLKKIPRDKRHNSKIDYMKLREILRNKQGKSG